MVWNWSYADDAYTIHTQYYLQDANLYKYLQSLTTLKKQTLGIGMHLSDKKLYKEKNEVITRTQICIYYYLSQERNNVILDKETSIGARERLR